MVEANDAHSEIETIFLQHFEIIVLQTKIRFSYEHLTIFCNFNCRLSYEYIQILLRKLQHIYLVRRMFVVLLESTVDNLRTNKRSLHQVFEPNNFHGGKMARSCCLVVTFVLFDKETSLVVVVNQS